MSPTALFESTRRKALNAHGHSDDDDFNKVLDEHRNSVKVVNWSTVQLDVGRYSCKRYCFMEVGNLKAAIHVVLSTCHVYF
jgi:hypothetical protein